MPENVQYDCFFTPMRQSNLMTLKDGQKCKIPRSALDVIRTFKAERANSSSALSVAAHRPELQAISSPLNNIYQDTMNLNRSKRNALNIPFIFSCKETFMRKKQPPSLWCMLNHIRQFNNCTTFVSLFHSACSRLFPSLRSLNMEEFTTVMQTVLERSTDYAEAFFIFSFLRNCTLRLMIDTISEQAALLFKPWGEFYKLASRHIVKEHWPDHLHIPFNEIKDLLCSVDNATRKKTETVMSYVQLLGYGNRIPLSSLKRILIALPELRLEQLDCIPK